MAPHSKRQQSNLLLWIGTWSSIQSVGRVLHQRQLQHKNKKKEKKQLQLCKRLVGDLRKVQCCYLVGLCWEDTGGVPNDNWLLCLLSSALLTDCRYLWSCLLWIFLFLQPLPSSLSPPSSSLSQSISLFFHLPFIPWTNDVRSAVFFSVLFPQLVLSSHFILRNMGMVIILHSFCRAIQFRCD